MNKLGISISFINVIKLLFQDTIVSININNHLIWHFKLHRGIRQRLSFSSLFIIIVEAVNAIVKYAMRTSHINGIALPQGNSQQLISQYVEDMPFIVRANESGVDTLVGVLCKFRAAFDLESN